MTAIATQSVLHDLSLSCIERVLMSKFNDFSNQCDEFFAHLGCCAEHLGLSRRQVQRIITNLVKKNKIEKTGELHRNTWELYRICPDTTKGGGDINDAPPTTYSSPHRYKERNREIRKQQQDRE